MLALVLVTFLAADVPAPVTAAVVYGRQARVTRSGEARVSGRERLTLPLLPVDTDPSSVRVAVEGAVLETVEVVRLGPGDGPPANKEALERLDDDLALVATEQTVLTEVAALGDHGPSAPDDEAGWGAIDPSRWGQALVFLRGWRERLDQRRRGVDQRASDLKARKAALVEQEARERAEGKVRVTVQVDGHGPARVRASYTVAGPGWSPRYELRLAPDADQVMVGLVAQAEQRTGESWDRVALTFSTALPVISMALPALPRWIIGDNQRFVPAASTSAEAQPGATTSPHGYVYDQTGSPIRGVKVVATAGGRHSYRAYTDARGAFVLPGVVRDRYDVTVSAPRLRTVVQRDVILGSDEELNFVVESDTAAVEEVRVVEKAPVVSTSSASVKSVVDMDFVEVGPSRPRAQRAGAIALAAPPGYQRPRLAPDLPAVLAGGHDLSFDAVAPETLASGQPPRRVPLATWRWPVSLRRQLYPAVRPEAYLVATLRSPAATVLPAGEATVFSEGQAAGRTRLELIRPGQAFSLPLGSDRAVRAVRQVQLQTRAQGLIARREVDRYTVTIDVANPHRRGVALDVIDQVPRARDGSVDVKLLSSTPPARLDADGKIVWQTGVAAGATARFSFVYELTQPRGNQLHQ